MDDGEPEEKLSVEVGQIDLIEVDHINVRETRQCKVLARTACIGVRVHVSSRECHLENFTPKSTSATYVKATTAIDFSTSIRGEAKTAARAIA